MLPIKTWGRVIYALAITAGMGVFLMPVPAGADPAVFHINSIASVMFTVSSLGAAALFLLELNGFSDRLKMAYTLMCAGFSMTGLYSIQLSVINILSLQNTSWAQLFITVSFASAAALLYYGMRKFARLFGVHLLRNSSLAAQTVAVGSAVGLVLYQHSPGAPFDARVGLMTFTAIEALFAGWLALLVSTHAGAGYRRPTRLLGAALFLLMVGSVIQVVASFAVTHTIDGLSDTIALLPQVLGAFVLVRAAVLFPGIDDAKQKPTTSADVASGRVAIDVVVYAAGLVSNPHNVDPALDALRAITAQLKAGSRVSSSEESRLAKSYLEIEHYLDAQEPVRQYPTAALRKKIEQMFGEGLAKSKFWQQIRTR